MLRDTDRVSAGRAHDENAAARGFFEVDVVDTHARAPDDAEAGRFFQELRSDFGGAAHDQGIGVGDLRVECFLGGQDDVPSGAAQQVHAAFTDLVRYDHFHRVSFLAGLPPDVFWRRVRPGAARRTAGDDWHEMGRQT